MVKLTEILSLESNSLVPLPREVEKALDTEDQGHTDWAL